MQFTVQRSCTRQNKTKQMVGYKVLLPLLCVELPPTQTSFGLLYTPGPEACASAAPGLLGFATACQPLKLAYSCDASYGVQMILLGSTCNTNKTHTAT